MANYKDILKNIKLVVADCDGTLTDGNLYYSDNGCEMKLFNVKDGMAVSILKEHNIKAAVITGRNCKIIKKRAKELSIDNIYVNIEQKMNYIYKLKKIYKLEWKEIAYIGDDINDLECIKLVGFGCCVSGAVEEVKENSLYITKAKGGCGAFRELADMIVKCQ